VKKSWKLRTLYKFCSQTNCTDGDAPAGALVIDSSGNLYGTTDDGGNENGGVVYELQKGGAYKVLYSFCALSQCADGSHPFAGLAYQGQQSGETYDGVSTLYGTAARGGPMNWGVVYTIAPGEAESVLYGFGADDNADDGDGPTTPLILDSAGNLYGTTPGGGSTGGGTIFGITPQGSETLSFAFCSQEPQDCGADPGIGGLLMTPDGTLFGTTQESEVGGTLRGVLYSFANGTYSTLANFCAHRKCKQGVGPEAALVQGPSGNLYGSASQGGGGTDNSGAVFEFTGSRLRAIYKFCAKPKCADGSNPYSRLLITSHGAMLGTTSQGGAFNEGTIFELR
jgi:uncharacterized repeat protein (TIGR03803 family)